MKTLALDAEACSGHGRCYEVAPALFEEDECGHCVLRHESVPTDLEAEAQRGVDACPERALRLLDAPPEP